MNELPPDIPSVYLELEWLQSSPENDQKSRIGTFFDWLSQVSKEFSSVLFGDLEPRVWEYIDQFGNSWWVIHDPLADEPYRWLSINDTRVWLEQHYHSSTSNFYPLD